MIQIIRKRHHEGDAGPVGTKGSICGNDVDVFEFVHTDVAFLVQVRVESENLIKCIPLDVKLILALLSIFSQGWVLQMLEVLVIPVHEDVGIFRPALERVVMDASWP